MKKNIVKIINLLLIISFIGSCASRKDLIYLQDIGQSSEIKESEIRLKVDDQLSITVSSIDNMTALPFNLPVAAFSDSGISVAGNPQLQTYLISRKGTIEFPQLGTLKLVGLSLLEAVNLLKEKLIPFLDNPIVNIRILNFKISVLGEVLRPGQFSVNNERITILEALGMAGDMTIWGERKSVLVIRENNLGRKNFRVDLTSNKLFESPVYYLEQNDVVYVEPNKPKINSSTNSSTNGIIISAVSLLLTIISITLR